MSSVFNSTPQPLQIPGCALWLDAADANSITQSGGNVSVWRDKSGNTGRDAVPSTGSGGTYPSNSINGLATVGMTISGNMRAPVPAQTFATELSAFVVFMKTGTNTKDTVIHRSPGVNNDVTCSPFLSYTGTRVIGNGTVAAFTTGATNPFSNVVPTLYNFNINSNANTTWNEWINGTGFTYTLTGGTPGYGDTSTQVWLGAGTIVANPTMAGVIAEVIMYNRTPTTQQRQFIEGYLANKWGLQSSLPASHPYRNTFANNFGYPLDWWSAEQSLVSFSSNTPTQIPGLALWLDAADATTVQFSSGANVSNWRDKSGNGRNATQPTGSNQPTYSSNSVVFGQSLFLTTPLSASANTETIYMVTLLSNITYSSVILGQSNGSSGGRQFDIQYTANAGSCSARLIRMNQIFVNTASVPQPANRISLAEYTNNGTSSTIYWNGTPINTSITPSAFSGSFTTAIGTRGAALVPRDQFFYGSLYEILVYSNVLADAQRQQVESYLAKKWNLQSNLPSAHLFKTNEYYNIIPIQNITLQSTSDSINSFARFQPTSLSGLALWLDGADPLNNGIQPTSGATISTWSDKSGNGRDATVASNRVAGTYNTAFNCVYFQSSNVGYATSYSANPTVETMFIVANIDSPANINNNTIIGGERGARSFGFGYSGSGGGAGASGRSSYLNSQVAWQNTFVTGPSAGTTALITGTVTNTTNVTVSLNGATSGASYTSGTITAWTAGTTTYLGVDTTTPIYYYKGYVMEILFYNSVLTTNQRQQIEGYLAWKWGLTGSLPSSHPNKNMPPN